MTGRGQRVDRDGPLEISMPQCPFCQIPSTRLLGVGLILHLLLDGLDCLAMAG